MICLMATFFANAQYTSMAIVGDGTIPMGWPGETGNPGPTDVYQMSTTDNIHWTYDNLTTYAGSIKFRAENSWANNWGGATFPNGVGLFDSQTNNIPNTVGVFDVTFNSTTLEYTFIEQEPEDLYPVISLIGPATTEETDNWTTDIDLSTTDGIQYSINGVTLFTGPVKFRQDGEWTNNWAPPTFPSGTAVFDSQESLNITGGVYDVTFNLETLAYSFDAVAAVDTFEMNRLKVYPNPTQNSWSFASPIENISSIVIVDMLGKTVLTVAGNNNEQTIDASGLSKGVYIAKIATANGTNTIKLVKN